MNQKKANNEIDRSQLDKNIAMLERNIAKQREESIEMTEEQAKQLHLFYKLRRVAFVQNKSLLISLVTNFIVFNIVLHAISLIITNIKGKFEFSLVMLITLFVCLSLGNIFLLKAIRAWVIKNTVSINQQIEDARLASQVLDVEQGKQD